MGTNGSSLAWDGRRLAWGQWARGGRRKQDADNRNSSAAHAERAGSACRAGESGGHHPCWATVQRGQGLFSRRAAVSIDALGAASGAPAWRQSRSWGTSHSDLHRLWGCTAGGNLVSAIGLSWREVLCVRARSAAWHAEGPGAAGDNACLHPAPLHCACCAWERRTWGGVSVAFSSHGASLE